MLPELQISSREFLFEPQARYVMVGVRQSGKSFLLYLRAMQLLAQGHDIKEMLFINFDDERLIGMKVDELDLILQAYSALYDLKPVIFLDEIQNVEGWEHLQGIGQSKYHVYVTGSNAKMLSKEIASTLGARYIEQRVFPYSFPEFLNANGIHIDKKLELWQN